jgi:hypothetical protein
MERPHMCGPHLDFTNVWMQEYHAACSLVDEEITSNDVQWETRKRVWVRLSRDNGEPGENG